MHAMHGGGGDISDDERNRSGRVEVIPTSYPMGEMPSPPSNPPPPLAGTSEDLHAWSIYRQVIGNHYFLPWDYICTLLVFAFITKGILIYVFVIEPEF